jgi:hypothetical protein
MKKVVKECIKRILPIRADYWKMSWKQKKKANLDKKIDIVKR